MSNLRREFLSFSCIVVAIIIGPWDTILCILSIFILLSILISFAVSIFKNSSTQIKKKRIKDIKRILSSTIHLPPQDIMNFVRWLDNENFKFSINSTNNFCLLGATVQITYFDNTVPLLSFYNTQSKSNDAKIYERDEELKLRMIEFFKYITKRELDEHGTAEKIRRLNNRRDDDIFPDGSIFATSAWNYYVRLQGYLFLFIILYRVESDMFPPLLKFIIFSIYAICEMPKYEA